jgi:tetratricopeptide (TPR) repeat protein
MTYLKPIGIAVLILLSAVFGTLGARWVASRAPSPASLGANLDPSAPAPAGLSAFSTEAIISNLQTYLQTHPTDSSAYSNLGIAYLQKVRENGDPAYYTRADAALTKALALTPTDFRALTGAGALALARHQFQVALTLGQQAQAQNPYNASADAIVGDAHIELGQYPEAFDTFNHMVNLRPDLDAYARISYARELSGDRAGAVTAMQQAAEAGGSVGEATAWARVQLGNLYYDQGQTAEAGQTYQAALEAWPNYAYAEAGLANVWAAMGNTTQAISMYTQVVNTYPLPQFVISLGDLYAVTGQAPAAARTYDLVDAEEKLYIANGVDVDAELALFDADHNRQLPEALARARADYVRRPSVTVADMLAWTLYQSGDYAEAQQTMRQALHLGTRNALMFYHAGLIAYQLGQTAEAANYLEQAVTLNPHFSLLYADRARQLLAQLRPLDPSALAAPKALFGGGD